MITDENSVESFDGFLPTSTVLGLSWSLFVVALGFSITTCVLCCCACCSRQRNYPAQQQTYSNNPPTGSTQLNRHSTGVQTKHFVLAAAALVLVFASIMASSYATARNVLDNQDYKGLMRITGWAYSDTFSQSSQDHNEQTVFKHYVEADLHLDWGYSWACPDHGNKACTSTGSNSISKCETVICQSRKQSYDCSDEELRAAQLQVEQCANSLFDPSLAESGYYVPYDKDEGPSNDVNWPSIKAYGDCSDCSARDKAPRPDALQGLRISAIIFLVVAFSVVGGASVCWVRETKKMKDSSNQPTLPVSEVVAPYSPSVNRPEQNPVANSYMNSGISYGMGAQNTTAANVTPVSYSNQTTASEVYNPYMSNNSNSVPVVSGVVVQPVQAAASPPIVYAESMPKSM
jgi:hypothetical protein